MNSPRGRKFTDCTSAGSFSPPPPAVGVRSADPSTGSLWTQRFVSVFRHDVAVDVPYSLCVYHSLEKIYGNWKIHKTRRTTEAVWGQIRFSVVGSRDREIGGFFRDHI